MNNYGDRFDQLFDYLLEKEGGYVDNCNDLGGQTKYGITEKTARSFGYKGKMRDLTLAFAKKIYFSDYWVRPWFSKVDKTSSSIAEFLFLSSVVIGQGRIVVFLQKSLNAFNLHEKIYKDLKVDGLLREKTLFSLSAYLSVRDEDVLLKALNIFLGEHFLFLAQRNKTQEEFVYGWIKQRIKL